MTAPRILALLALMGICLGQGCGSSGGSSPSPSSSVALSGTYEWSAWVGDVGVPQVIAQWGTGSADGAGQLELPELFQNRNGSASGPLAAPSAYAVEVGAGNALTMAASVNLFTGGVTADGSAAILASDAGTIDPGIAVLTRRGAGHDAADLTGSYHVCAFLRNGAIDRELSWWGGSASFDGAGTCTAFATGFNDGFASFPAGPALPGGSYAVAADGTVTWTPPTGGPLRGCLLGGGEAAVLAGSTTNGIDFQVILVLVKAGAGMSDAALAGSYHDVLLLSQRAPDRFGSASGTISADGAGELTIQAQTLNIDGTPDAWPVLPSMPYAVAADGALSVSATAAWMGAVSPSGRYAVWSGGTEAGSLPQLWLLLR